jgi:hypothetical protein
MSFFTFGVVAISLTIFAAILVALEIGSRSGRARYERDSSSAPAGTGAIDGAIFGLMGLLLAFAFSGAASRLDTRRSLIVEESNTIGTAYLRLDLLPAEAQVKLKEDFRQYVDSRLAIYRALPNVELAKYELGRSAEIQGRIWSGAVAAIRELNNPAATSLVLSNINDMIDITLTRTVAMQTHPPPIIFVVLVVMVLASALLAGYNMSAGKVRNWTHRITFAVLMTLALHLIFDLEFPRFGLIRVDAFDQILVDVRNTMK